MKRILLTLSMALASTALFAIPASRQPFFLTQADGSSMVVCLVGDEYMHYYETVDGIPLVKNDHGLYRPATHFEAETMKAQRAQHIKRRNAERAHRTLGKRSDGTYFGEKHGIIILVDYTDVKMKYPRSTFDAMYNQPGYSEGGHTGSLYDYFLEQSYGLFTVRFDVVGPFTLSHPMQYYGSNRNSGGSDSHAGEMICEAIHMADSQVNFADYDWDGDGEVDQIYVIYAGTGENYSGADENAIWPHESSLSSHKDALGDGEGVITADGVTIDTYACSNELHPDLQTLCGIGTAAHEFSHCLGLPDMYDTNGQTNYAMLYWDVMDEGCYLGSPSTSVPCGYTTFERMFAGWITPTELSDPCVITDMQPLAVQPEAYIVYNDANHNEYYLLENRQNVGFDSRLYGHGMLVIHVDYDEQTWVDNRINIVADHQRCTIIPADNQYWKVDAETGRNYIDLQSVTGDPYPGSSGNTSLTDTSVPSAVLFNVNTDGRNLMGKPIEEIAENGDLISFRFMGGEYVESPHVLVATAVSPSAFTANWQAVDKADSYTIQLRYNVTSSIADMKFIADDLNGLASMSNSSNTDISNSLDQYMSDSGWTGTRVYAAKRALRLGNARMGGILTSPLIPIPATGVITIGFGARPLAANTDMQMTISLIDSDDNILVTRNITSSASENSVTCTGINKPFKVKFTPNGQHYIFAIKIYDGTYTYGQMRAGGIISYNKVDNFTTTATTYTMSQLDTSTIYTYRIRTNSNTSISKWSQWYSPSDTPQETNSPADVNHDGTVDTQDVLAIYQWMQTAGSPTAAEGTTEDVNRDGTVDTQDVLVVYDQMQND